LPLIFTNTSSKCQRHWGKRRRWATRFFRISAANIGPNRFHQNRTVSWLMSIPRSAKRSSTLRSDSGYLTYIITTRRMTSGELLKYRNGLLITQAYYGQSATRIWSDKAPGGARTTGKRRLVTAHTYCGHSSP